MRAVCAGAFVAVFLLALPARAEDAGSPRPVRDPEILDRLARIAVQDRGRIKPLDTFAGFTLLKINGRRSVTTPDGESLGPMAWLHDVIFFPERAEKYACLLVQNDEALDAIGLEHETKKKRDRYSFAEFDQKSREKLYEKAREYATNIKEADQTPVQSQVVQLYHNLAELGSLLHALDFARKGYVPASGAKFFPEIKDDRLSAILARGPAISAAFEKAKDPAEVAAYQQLVEAIDDHGGSENVLAIFPPPSPDEREWLTVSRRRSQRDFPDPDGLIERAFRTNDPLERQIGLLAALEDCERTKTSPADFKANVLRLTDGLQSLAQSRGEYSKIPLEVAFYKADFFFHALWLYILAFVIVAVSWMQPDRRLFGAGLVALGVGTAVLVTGIVFRCVIRSRPPVSTLYETILFITACAVIVCFAIEYLNRQRIATAIASVLGSAGMFLAMKYEFKESVNAGDTMPSLVAVLDTNFWLSTHVTSVTLGYSAGLLASAIAHVWLVGRILALMNVRRPDAAFQRNVARMVYGVLCFGLLFSTVGTILGGIWANYSWGRFWGWDPKENGALMIVLWELMILHARMGGYIRDQGLCVLAVMGGGVVAFSWWGVNLLGVGLHSYGFTSGIFQALVAFYALEAGILLVLAGVLCARWLLARGKKAPEQDLAAAAH